ncbi:hypothetical protein [Elizabethkingia bruuniana]|uniref:hypothetical protein n=1 Tax=Elizabethkingia bruuniana TaxID=1756149 RepID=UPI00241DB888|nr:hypothetical protein [Elizabethkingia bruuniana]
MKQIGMAETNNHFLGLFNKSPFYNIIKIISIILIIWVILRTFFPSFLFTKKYSVTRSNIKYIFYSNKDLDIKVLEKFTDSVQKNISTSSLFRAFSEKNPHTNLFICNSPVLYSFLVPFNRKGFATSSKLTNNIYISNLNLKTGLATTYPKSKKVTNTILITHEITHLMLYNSNIYLKGWIEEGYCEYIAYGSNIEVKKMLKKSTNDKYIKYMLGVSFLLKQNNNNLKKLENSNINNEIVLEEIRQHEL